MPFYYRQGDIPKKRHIAFYKEDEKSLYREELFSTQGFSSIYSNRYRLDMPTKVSSIAHAQNLMQMEAWQDAPLMWHLFHSARQENSGSLHQAQSLWMENSNCTILTSSPTQNCNDFHKNAHEHLLIFIHRGQGTFLSEFGSIDFAEGDYIVIPKGCIYQFQFTGQENRCFMVLSDTAFEIPKHFRNDMGQLLEDAPYCERDLKLPVLQSPIDSKGNFPVHISCKYTHGRKTYNHVWDHHPFDVVGWDGCEYPFAFNIKDYAPKVGALHLPPPVHLVFTTQHFVVCNFVPRLFDFYPDAIPAPYFHSNVDSDEIIYYADGDFMSRKGIEPGSISYHPMGIAHGPQPGKTEASIGQKETHEYAVMVDTFAPLNLSKQIQAVSDPNYWRSWSED